MPRIARVVVSKIPHHITQRGNRREQIFFDDKDRRAFLSLLKTYTRKHDLRIDAYCLMPNHVHLVARPMEESSLGRTLKPVFLRYAQHINEKNGWIGRLWQGRFFSCPLDENHFWAAVRYVERNPVRAALVQKPEHYRWSSAACHCGLGSDGLLSDSQSLRRTIGDWTQWLGVPENEELVKNIRTNTRTGRPVGDESFVHSLERRLKRSLKASPKGRPWPTKERGRERKGSASTRL